MNTDINERLHQAQWGIMRLHKIDSILKQLKSEQMKLARQEHELKAVLSKEYDDIQKLENTSLISIFYSILGSLDEHVEKERKDILAAKLKLDQNAKDLHDIYDGFSGTKRAFYDSPYEPTPILFMFHTTANMQVKADTTSLKAAIATCNNLLEDLKAAGNRAGLVTELTAEIAKANAVANSKNPIWIDVNAAEVVLMDYAHFAADSSAKDLDYWKQYVDDQKNRVDQILKDIKERAKN